MREYIQCAVLAISSVKFAEFVNWLPAPETIAQAIVISLLSGFIGALGKWLFERAKRKIKLYLNR